MSDCKRCEQLTAERDEYERRYDTAKFQAALAESRAARAEALVEAGLGLADEALAWAEPAVLDINAEKRSVAKWVVRYVADLRDVLGGAK